MSESRINSYPKIYNMGHPQIGELFSDDVLVEEKIDGSQFSFGVIGGELMCRSRGKQLVLDAPEKMFLKAIESVRSIEHLLEPDCIYRGEYLQKPKHNTLCYDFTPPKNIILFDIDDGSQNYWSYERKQAESERLGLMCVKLMHSGKVKSYEEFKVFLDEVSELGGCNIEGVVIKNYSRFGRDGKALMGKFVSEAFKESHQTEWKKSNPTQKDVQAILIDSLKTDARWEKAVQHLRERGAITDSPKDIAALIKEVQVDTKEEEEDMIKKRLFSHFWPHISRGITAGLPQWYKEKLAKAQFEVEK